MAAPPRTGFPSTSTDCTPLQTFLGLETFDFIAAGVIAEGQFKAGPGVGNTGIHKERRPAKPKTQNPFHSCAVHPTGGAGIPCPASSARVRSFRVDISGHDIRLHFIALDIGARAGMVMGLSIEKSSPGLIAVAQARRKRARPKRRRGYTGRHFRALPADSPGYTRGSGTV